MTTTPVERRPLGDTGLTVPALGLGAMQLGDPAVPDAEAERLLRGAIERGVTLIDTARAYGLSEDRIGRFLAAERDRFVLSTKVGYGIAGVADWTPEAVTRGVEEARQRLRTDVIDIVHLHSCGRGTFEQAGVVEALAGAVAAGRARVAAYSGENDALAYAVGLETFGVVQASVNFLDQAGLAGPLAEAARRGVGILAKRPLATAPWRRRGAEGIYIERFGAVRGELEDLGDEGWAEMALRFAAFAPGVSCCLLGTRRLESLEVAVDALAAGRLPGHVSAALTRAFASHGAGWEGVV